MLLFFSFSAAVILQMFAAADHKRDISTLAQKSVICAQSAAEAFSVSGSLSETVMLVFGTEAEKREGYSFIMLNEDFKSSENGIIELRITENAEETDAGQLKRLDMAFLYGGSELYALECFSYIPEKGGCTDE